MPDIFFNYDIFQFNLNHPIQKKYKKNKSFFVKVNRLVRNAMTFPNNPTKYLFFRFIAEEKRR